MSEGVVKFPLTNLKKNNKKVLTNETLRCIINYKLKKESKGEIKMLKTKEFETYKDARIEAKNILQSIEYITSINICKKRDEPIWVLEYKIPSKVFIENCIKNVDKQ